MKRFFLLTCSLAFLFIPSLSQAATFGAQEATLPNGLRIVVIPNHRSPVIAQMVWVKVGGADNLPGQSGMAHYFEHLMFKGTKTMPPGAYSKTIKILGGNDNAFTSLDYTAYFESVAAAQLPKVMAMEADRFQNLIPPQKDFESEKAVVLEERRQRTDNDPASQFGEQMNAALYTNHPYNTPVIGWLDEIKGYEWPDVKRYYDAWYAPNNMILVISGDTSLKEVMALAQNTYGHLPRKELPQRLRPAIPPSHGDTLITYRSDQIYQPSYSKISLAPTEAKNRADSLALQVLADILDGGSSTRLYQSLVVAQKKLVQISFSYNANALDYGTISIEAVPAQGVSLAEVDILIAAEITKILKSGVSDQEVTEAVQRLQDKSIYARDSVMGPAMIFGQALATGSTIDDVESWSDDIAKVTKEDIARVAQTYLNAEKPWIRKPVTGYLLPTATSSHEGK